MKLVVIGIAMTWASFVPARIFAQTRADIAFNQEYACKGGSRFIVRSCEIKFNTDSCKLDYINEATPGRFVSTEMNRALIEGTLPSCTVAGTAVASSSGPVGRPGQALEGASWRDVTILEQAGNLVHVRWGPGVESWWPADKVRELQPPQDIAGGIAPTGQYVCYGAGGNPVYGLNFSITATGEYLMAQNGMRGSFSTDPDGATTFTGYIAQVMPSGFLVRYHVDQGLPKFSFFGSAGKEAEWCERR